MFRVLFAPFIRSTTAAYSHRFCMVWCVYSIWAGTGLGHFNTLARSFTDSKNIMKLCIWPVTRLPLLIIFLCLRTSETKWRYTYSCQVRPFLTVLFPLLKFYSVEWFEKLWQEENWKESGKNSVLAYMRMLVQVSPTAVVLTLGLETWPSVS
jgi:hypothetical protein